MEKHFVCEFVTAGGMRDRTLPQGLRHEGTLLRDALLAELGAQPGQQLSLSFDDRLPPPPRGRGRPISDARAAWAVWEQCLSEADYFWPVAPESEALLYRLTRMAEGCRARIIGPPAAAIPACADKWRLYRTLDSHQLPCAPTGLLCDGPGAIPSTAGWVAKPILGAGCQDCRWLGTRDQVAHFMQHCPAPGDYILQAWITGEALSLSTLMCDGQAAILSCNRQQVAVHRDGRLTLRTLVINAMPPDAEQERLAGALAALFPALIGFIGMDLIRGAGGCRLLEINARLTSVLRGISAILDRPLTALLQELFTRRRLPAFRRNGQAVTLALEAASDDS